MPRSIESRASELKHARALTKPLHMHMQARIGAQEHVLNLAQQLIDKEKVLVYINSALILLLHTQHTSRAGADRQGKGAACMYAAVCTSV